MKFNSLIPELTVADLERSLSFYIDLLGFSKEYGRAKERFAFLTLGQAQLMLEQSNGNWETGNLEYPFGRGMNLQIEVEEIQSLINDLKNAGHNLFKEPRDEWYQVKDGMRGQRQFLVLDPDGYLLRFYQHLASDKLGN